MSYKYQIAIYRDMPTPKEKDAKVIVSDKLPVKVTVIRHFMVEHNGVNGIVGVIYRKLSGTMRIKLDQRSMRHYREHFDVVDMRGLREYFFDKNQQIPPIEPNPNRRKGDKQ